VESSESRSERGIGLPKPENLLLVAALPRCVEALLWLQRTQRHHRNQEKSSRPEKKMTFSGEEARYTRRKCAGGRGGNCPSLSCNL
jgi:hypothetical protein